MAYGTADEVLLTVLAMLKVMFLFWWMKIGILAKQKQMKYSRLGQVSVPKKFAAFVQV